MTPLAALLAAALALAPGPRVRPGIPGYPRVARPATAAQRRINTALARIERRTRAAARDCLDGGGNPTDWRRRIAATMRGPAFLSYAVEDEVDCGGAHPSTEHAALVFDLATGALVDWARLLPRSLYGTLESTPTSDGVGVPTLASERLTALYAQRYDAALKRQGGLGDCRGMMDVEPGRVRKVQPMVAWLDARRGGLVLQFDLGNAMKACSLPVLIPTAMLAREGASPRLLAAMSTARR